MLRHIPSDPSRWSEYDSCILLRVEALTLTPDALADPGLAPHVMVRLVVGRF